VSSYFPLGVPNWVPTTHHHSAAWKRAASGLDESGVRPGRHAEASTVMDATRGDGREEKSTTFLGLGVGTDGELTIYFCWNFGLYGLAYKY
jgi:hypothetical protein